MIPIATLKETFEKVDTNGDRLISFEEFLVAIQDLGLQPEPQTQNPPVIYPDGLEFSAADYIQIIYVNKIDFAICDLGTINSLGEHGMSCGLELHDIVFAVNETEINSQKDLDALNAKTYCVYIGERTRDMKCRMRDAYKAKARELINGATKQRKMRGNPSKKLYSLKNPLAIKAKPKYENENWRSGKSERSPRKKSRSYSENAKFPDDNIENLNEPRSRKVGKFLDAPNKPITSLISGPALKCIMDTEEPVRDSEIPSDQNDSTYLQQLPSEAPLEINKKKATTQPNLPKWVDFNDKERQQWGRLYLKYFTHGEDRSNYTGFLQEFLKKATHLETVWEENSWEPIRNPRAFVRRIGRQAIKAKKNKNKLSYIKL